MHVRVTPLRWIKRDIISRTQICNLLTMDFVIL